MPKPDDTEDNKDLDDASKIQSAVETANAEDETDTGSDDDDQSDDDSVEEESDNKDDTSTDDDSEDDEKSDDDEKEKKDDSEDKDSAERKFKNLAADDDAQYIKNIERAYENSSAEAVRLNAELGNMSRRVDAIIAAAEKDPDLAKQLNKVLGVDTSDDSSGVDSSLKNGSDTNSTDDPFLIDSKTKWEQKSKEEVEAILDANPEINSDPKLNADVKHWMEVFSKEEFRVKKRLMSGGEAMEAAMKHLGIEDKRQKQDIANASKDLAAPTRPTKSRTPKPKAGKGLSDAAADFADKLGVAREKAEKYAQQ